MQFRFMQMNYQYGEAMSLRIKDILAKPVNFLPAIMRELDPLPGRPGCEVYHTVTGMQGGIPSSVSLRSKPSQKRTHKPASPSPRKSSPTS
jgi:hypothetical protein